MKTIIKIAYTPLEDSTYLGLVKITLHDVRTLDVDLSNFTRSDFLASLLVDNLDPAIGVNLASRTDNMTCIKSQEKQT